MEFKFHLFASPEVDVCFVLAVRVTLAPPSFGWFHFAVSLKGHFSPFVMSLAALPAASKLFPAAGFRLLLLPEPQVVWVGVWVAVASVVVEDLVVAMATKTRRSFPSFQIHLLSVSAVAQAAEPCVCVAPAHFFFLLPSASPSLPLAPQH